MKLPSACSHAGLYLCAASMHERATSLLPPPSLPSSGRQHLREAAVEMCAPPQRTSTRSETNKHCTFSNLESCSGLCLFRRLLRTAPYGEQVCALVTTWLPLLISTRLILYEALLCVSHGEL